MYERMKKNQPVSIMKKLRSKIPRRKRFQISPILSNSLYGQVSKQPDDDLSSVFPPVVSSPSWISDEISCTSNLISSFGSEKFKSTRKKKQVVISETTSTHHDSLYEQEEIQRTSKEKVVSELVSESTSGVDFCGKVDENEGGDTVSEAISFSETSCIQPAISQRKSRKNFRSEDYSCNDSAKKAKISVEIQGDSVSEISFVKSSSELKNQKQIARVKDDEIRAPETSTFSEVSRDYYNVEVEIANSESTANQKPNDTESDCKFSLSEDYPYSDEESDYSMTISQLDSEIFPRNSDVEVEFSDYTDESSLFDSESQTDFSQPGNSNPYAYFSYFRQYSKQFSKLSSAVSHYKEVPSQIQQEDFEEYTFLKFEDENHEDSYKKLRSRERNHAIRNDYSEDYYSTTEYGDLVLQQRHSMVNWIIDESGVRLLNLETVFLGVSLLDRFLSKGFFQNKRNLQLLGIACLTLATRIEENQPYNCVMQKTFRIGSDVYSRCEVVAMEWLVQEVLNFQCFLPTTYNFLWCYLKAARADQETEDKAKYLAVLSLTDPELLCYWPSTVAAGLVILAALASNQDSSCQFIMETHLRTKNDDLPECIKSLDWLVQYA
ncbi:hypothetical protein MKW92_018514 [Papaver armeniacum]|nr:hypothetical protein MKW92_018514 [Papaver armeniacum]